MKTLKLTVLILTMLIINSCGKNKDERNICCAKSVYDCLLWIRFQDTLGNDLVKGIDWTWQPYISLNQEETQAIINKNKKLYTLEVVYPEVYMLSTGYGYYYLDINENNHYLSFQPQVSPSRYLGKELPPADKIIYKLSCPYIFGDDAVHEIVTYWKPDKSGYQRQLCYLIEFEGKEFPVEESFATIILDR